MKIYSPSKEIMNVVVFFSGGASSLKAMLNDENYGKLYRVTGAYTDKEDASGRQLCKDNGIPDLFISRNDFYSKNELNPNNWSSRYNFYEMLTKEIKQFNPDIICMSGYMHILSHPILKEYENRILNVHPADLTILSSPTSYRLDVSRLSSKEVRKLTECNKLTRKIKGENAVYDAIASGEQKTRSTVHIAREDFDEGPILVQSKPFIVNSEILEKINNGDLDGLKEYSSCLQNNMKSYGDGPAYLRALELISQGYISVDGDTVFLNDKELPYCGVRL